MSRRRACSGCRVHAQPDEWIGTAELVSVVQQVSTPGVVRISTEAGEERVGAGCPVKPVGEPPVPPKVSHAVSSPGSSTADPLDVRQNDVESPGHIPTANDPRARDSMLRSLLQAPVLYLELVLP